MIRSLFSQTKSVIANRTFASKFPAMARTGERSFSSYLVTPDELHAALQRKGGASSAIAGRTIPVCASWFLPNDPQKRTGLQVFKEAHIPSARFFDLDEVSDTSSPYPHMLPSANTFQHALQGLGIESTDTIVVYDSAEQGIFSAPRVAWTFRIFGHNAVHILNNFKLWVEQGLPTESGEPQSFPPSAYPLPTLEASSVAAFEDIRQLALATVEKGSTHVQILDARSEGRWRGSDPEPRPGLSSGHIPGSTSVPLPLLLDPKTKAFLPAGQLRAVFEQKNIDPESPIISSCGTGVTAAVIDAALTEAGYVKPRKIYDGSWTEWAQRVQPEDGLIVKS